MVRKSEKCKAYCKTAHFPAPREDRIKETVRLSVQALQTNLEGKTISRLEFLFRQAKYIEKRWWLFQTLILCVLWRGAYLGYGTSYFDRYMAVMTPLFVIMGIPELWKNRRNHSMEIEGTAYFSIRQIYAARLILFGLADLVIITVFLLTTSFTLKISFWNLAVQFLIPFIVSCSICFRTLCSRKFQSEYLAVLLCFIWSAVWFHVVLREPFYLAAVRPVWIGFLIFAAVYAGFCIYRVMKNCNKIWEVSSSWN